MQSLTKKLFQLDQNLPNGLFVSMPISNRSVPILPISNSPVSNRFAKQALTFPHYCTQFNSGVFMDQARLG